MAVKFHLSIDGNLGECHAIVGDCPYTVHYDFYDVEAASVCKICLELAKTAEPADGVLALVSRAEAGEPVKYSDIAIAMKPSNSLSKPRERVGRVAVKDLASLLYSMGRTFDGLKTDRISTEEFLRTGNAAVLGSKSNAALLADLLDASSLVLTADWSVTPIDVSLLRQINGRMTRTAALRPGEFRTVEPAWVTTIKGRWKAVDHPSMDDANKIIKEAVDDSCDSRGLFPAASKAFCNLAKMQPFGDGNKRSALLLANAIMLKRCDNTLLFTVPADDEKAVLEFNERLSAWYVDGDNSVIGWLADWNQDHCGEA